MARPRKPTTLHLIEGTYRKDRHGLPSPGWLAEPLGAPPVDWLPLAKALWHEVAGQVPRGVATTSDRVAFEILFRSLAKVRETSGCLTPALASQIWASCSAFGMTPADHAKLSAPPPLEPDPAEKYFYRGARCDGDA
jgi:hypothetical protein